MVPCPFLFAAALRAADPRSFRLVMRSLAALKKERSGSRLLIFAGSRLRMFHPTHFLLSFFRVCYASPHPLATALAGAGQISKRGGVANCHNPGATISAESFFRIIGDHRATGPLC